MERRTSNWKRRFEIERIKRGLNRRGGGGGGGGGGEGVSEGFWSINGP